MPAKSFSIFVVEDNEWYNKMLVHNLSMNPDFEVKSFKTGKDAMQSLHELPNLVTVDFRLPDMDGIHLLEKIKDYNPQIEVVIISEQEEIETAVDLLKAGAFDYLVKSKDIKQRLFLTIAKIRQQVGLKAKVETLQREVQGKYRFENTIIGQSHAIRQVFKMLEKAVITNISVIISGETGTGKEVIAKSIHYNSPRKNQPWVAVNMAAIPAELIESELFGHEKGAFTGANSRRIGKFEEASGGTLFLDEIGELDMNFQAKLLRVLQEKEIVRVGSNKPVKVDCRIVVATNRNLQDEVKKGNFREDLFYRLYGLPILLPPLRDRDNDVLILGKHFADVFANDNNLPPKTFSEAAKQKMRSYQWPGNVRELKSTVELAVVMSSTAEIMPEDLSLSQPDIVPDLLGQELTMREYNHRIIEIFMDKYDNDTKKVAERLSIGQTTVYRLLKELEKK